MKKPFKEVIKEVLEYEVNGYGCLMSALVADRFHSRIGPHSAVKALFVSGKYQHLRNEPTEIVFHLIQLGYANNVDMDKVLNFVGNEGCTLFTMASQNTPGPGYKEKEDLAKFLIKKRVRVKTIDTLFQIPCLIV